MLFDINRFHLLVLISWQATIFYASQQIFGIFANYKPEFRCEENGSWTTDPDEYERCRSSGLNVTFDNVEFFSTAIEFHWLRPAPNNGKWFSRAQFIGVLFGTISFGSLADRVGRKPVAVGTLSAGIVFSLVSAMSEYEWLFYVCRFLIGLTIGGALVVNCTYVMEMLLPKQRMALRAFFNWGTARLAMTFICWYTREWRSASIVCALVVVPAVLIMIFVFPESPTWLHSKGRLDEMRKSEKAIARWGGVEYVPVKHRRLERNKTLKELIRGGLLKRLATLWIMWFVASACGYAADLHSNSIYGDLYINQALFSILIALSKMVLVAVDTFFPAFSRRMLHQGAQGSACVCYAILTALVWKEYDGPAILIINLAATVFIEYTWDACYLCAVESMETRSRASTSGSCSFVARIGSFFSTFMDLRTLWPPSLYLIFTLLGTINLIISYTFLVETKGICLDNVEISEDGEIKGDFEEEEEMTTLEKK